MPNKSSIVVLCFRYHELQPPSGMPVQSVKERAGAGDAYHYPYAPRDAPRDVPRDAPPPGLAAGLALGAGGPGAPGGVSGHCDSWWSGTGCF